MGAVRCGINTPGEPLNHPQRRHFATQPHKSKDGQTRRTVVVPGVGDVVGQALDGALAADGSLAAETHKGEHGQAGVLSRVRGGCGRVGGGLVRGVRTRALVEERARGRLNKAGRVGSHPARVATRWWWLLLTRLPSPWPTQNPPP